MIVKEEAPESLITKAGLRLDGRKFDELRPIKFEVGILSQADGSAYIEQGRNKIIVAVYGPRELHPRHLAVQDKAIVRCLYRMSTFSVSERKSPAPSRRETELSNIITQAIEPSIFLEYYPRTSVDVYIQVIEADGGTRCASINATSLALADAGIPMRDLIAAVAVGKVEGNIVVDLADYEDKFGSADLPLAMLPRSEQITLLQMDGNFTIEEFDEAIKLGKDNMKKIYEMQREAIKKKYAMVREEFAADIEEQDISQGVDDNE